MVASNVVWNLTVPDTSPMIQYSNFARDCPLNNGVLQCTTDSAHVSNASDSTITINFFGTAIYLFGDVDGGTTYTTSLDYAPAVDGAVKGKDLLASYSNVPNSRSGGTLHQVVLSAKRFKADSILKFTGAVISVDTGLPSAKPKFTKFDITSSSVTLTPGWVKNGSYMQSGTEFSQVATLKFRGSGVAVYGLCSNTLQEFSTNYGQVATDTTSFPKTIFDTSDTNIFRKRPYKADDCLLYYNTGLPEGAHNLTYTTTRNNVLLSSFQVISVNGSKAGSEQTGGDDTLKTVGKILGIGVPAVVGIVIGIAALFLICCCWGLCIRRRHKAARVYLPPPARAAQEEPKPLDSAQASQPIIVLPVATYSPPPPPPPPPPPQTHLFIVASDSHPEPEPSTTWRPPPGSPEIPNARLRPQNQTFPVARTGEENHQYTNSFSGASARTSDPTYAASSTGDRTSTGRTMSFGESVPYHTRSALAEAAGIPTQHEPQAASPGNRSGVEHGAFVGRSVLSADGMSYPDTTSSKGGRVDHRSQAESGNVLHADTGPLPDVPPPVYEETRR